MKDLGKLRVLAQLGSLLVVIAANQVDEAGQRMGIPAVVLDTADFSHVPEVDDLERVMKKEGWYNVNEEESEEYLSVINRHYTDEHLDEIIQLLTV